MATMASKLPTEDRPLRIDPDLAAVIEKELEPLEGEDLEKGQAAVRTVLKSSTQGTFATIADAYRTAIREAVEA